MLRVVHDTSAYGWVWRRERNLGVDESFLMTPMARSLVLRRRHRGVSLRGEPRERIHAKVRAASRIPLMMHLIGNSTDAS
jgi:hypothetical protein